MAQDMSPQELLVALELQIAFGVDEAISDGPSDSYALSRAEAERRAAAVEQPGGGRFAEVLKKKPPPPPKAPEIDTVAVARSATAAASSRSELKSALDAFGHCDLQKGARSLVFSDGHPEARVMIIGEAPGRDEDIQGKPFVGRAGQLLDRMFDAIGMARTEPDAEKAIYITNILPWRPPQNRDPKPEEIAMMKPFVERHVELVQPDVLVLMGNISCHAMLGRRGITRLRGHWVDVLGRPALPMFHPAYLLRNPSAKREAWADLLELQARLRNLS